MFADDTSVSYASDSLDEIQNVINSELKNLNSWLIANRLSLNITKTEFMIIGSRQRMDATQNDIAIRIHDREINRADVVKSLGIHIDRRLSWSEHTHKISKKISSAIGALKEAPYSCFSLKHFLYRSEASRDPRVESSRPVKFLKTISNISLFFQFLSIKTSLPIFFFSHASMEFEYSLVKWFSRQFSVGFTYFHSL